jgi:hypothetical protein
MERPSSTHGRGGKFKQNLNRKNMRGRRQTGDPDMNGKIILK